MGALRAIPLLCLLFTSIIPLSLQAQWETIYHPMGNGTLPNIIAVHFIDFYNGFAVGTDPVSYQPPMLPITQGQIIKTIDNGDTWSPVYLVDSIKFSDVIMIDQNIAMAVGYHFNDPNVGIIARTEDSGLSWDTLMVKSKLRKLAFPTPGFGYAIGDSGLVLKSTDGGLNWTSVIVDPVHDLLSMFFVDSLKGFVCGDSTIFETSDGGSSWSLNFVGNGHLFDVRCNIFFSSASIGYFIARSDNSYILYKTIDGGSTWTNHNTISSGVNRHTLYFKTDSIGYISGQFELLKTVDGGMSWYGDSASFPGGSFWDDLSDIQFLSSGSGFLVGSSQYYRIVNPEDIIGLPNVNSISTKILSVFPNPSTGEVWLVKLPGELGKVIICNMVGERVYQRDLVGSEEQYIDISHFPAGLYSIQLQSNLRQASSAIVKL